MRSYLLDTINKVEFYKMITLRENIVDTGIKLLLAWFKNVV
ncbi:protein of unknown function [Candidatus Nitrosocosmicus franklandus]|uniref:Uncharacterized protein n=1 Tax=Candidatus Nitrosocosmicus franklandianus TaxID=1798806 RepID=A0A484I5Y0_9ARCH|nr:protein of unknown function [Candidatus Nitrosocosmicus franklandus]